MVLPLPHTLHHQAGPGFLSMSAVHLHSTYLRLYHNTTCGLHCNGKQSLGPVPVRKQCTIAAKTDADLYTSTSCKHVDKSYLKADKQNAWLVCGELYAL